MKHADIERATEEMVLPILEEGGYIYVDTEYVKEGADYYLRVYADKEGGITVDDCEAVSRALEQKLDEKDLIKDAYILEVSSPGLTRQLKKERDFAWGKGKLVYAKLYKAMDGQKEFTGILSDYDEESVTITMEEETVRIPRSDISLIRLEIEF